MKEQIPGIHHVTAIASDPQRNVDFYTHTLGLRLVKLTVNFDDPSTYHLYFGDERGSPGTLLTFFPWPDAARGQQGTGQVATTTFAVPEGSLDYWEDRLRRKGIALFERKQRFDEELLPFLDPDGMRLELVARPRGGDTHPWHGAGILPEHAIWGFDAVTMWHQDPGSILDLLTGIMDFKVLGAEGPRTRLQAASNVGGALVDVLHLPEYQRGRQGAGTVHHIAWRTADEAQQLAWRKDLTAQGLKVTPVIDRQYFRSIYFREPGGVLFEIATDPPGMDWDEPVDALGAGLRLPRWLELQRADVEAALPALVLPNG